MIRHKPDELQSRLRPFLSDKPQTPRELAGNLGVDYWLAAHALRSMAEKGEVVAVTQMALVQTVYDGRGRRRPLPRVHYFLPKKESVSAGSHTGAELQESENSNVR